MGFFGNSKIERVDELLEEYRNSSRKGVEPVKFEFDGISGYDTYNPSSIFTDGKNEYIAVRVEKRDSEFSDVLFFKRESRNKWTLATDKKYQLQDPYFSLHGDKIVFGGTEVFEHPEDPSRLWWRAKFMIGNEFGEFTHLFYGPNGMKDIRLFQLDDKIAILTRPQGEVGGRGKIGFAIANNLEEVEGKIATAKLINQFHDIEWGGGNQILNLESGIVGVLGHVAKFTVGDVRHYYPVVFAIDTINNKISKMKIIAERADFVDGPAKREDLKDVLFSGGLKKIDNDKYELIVGVSDAETQSIIINNPFKEIEWF